MNCITLLTDFGTQDAYVAQLKGQVLSICSSAKLIDITHSVYPQDIEAGAFLLSQAVPYFPSGTHHLAIVDPGVGTERRMIAAEVMTKTAIDAKPQLQRLVLPDNGLISLLLHRHEWVGGNYLTDQTFWRSNYSYTFHGRDIMGPVVAHWANGAQRADFGPECGAPNLLPHSSPEFCGNSILGKAIFLDYFGNVITNVSSEKFLLQPGVRVSVEVDGGRPTELPFVRTYGQCEVGQSMLLVGSHGYLELARAGGSAAEHMGIVRQSTLRFTVG